MPTAVTADKAGWWTRFLAILIDAIGVGIIAGAIASLLGAQMESRQYQGLSLLLQAAYFTYFWSAAGKGQTLGSRALNIRVVKTDGSSLDYAGAFLRFIGSSSRVWPSSSVSSGRPSTGRSRAGTTRSPAPTWSGPSGRSHERRQSGSPNTMSTERPRSQTRAPS